LDGWRRETERAHAHTALAIARGKQSFASARLEELNSLLEWIVGQSAEIAGFGSNCDLLKGWEKFYVYIRERLQEKEERDAGYRSSGWPVEQTEAEEAMDDMLFPQQRTNPMKALLVWIEREFPQIAAQYAPKPPSNGPACETTSFLVMEGESTKCVRKLSSKRAQLSQVHPSKVSKPGRKDRRTLTERFRAGQGRQELHEAAERRSERLALQARDNPSLRRSARIMERATKLRSPGVGSSTHTHIIIVHASRIRISPSAI